MDERVYSEHFMFDAGEAGIDLQPFGIFGRSLDCQRRLSSERLARRENRPIPEIRSAIDEHAIEAGRALQEGLYFFFVVILSVEEPTSVSVAERYREPASHSV